MAESIYTKNRKVLLGVVLVILVVGFTYSFFHQRPRYPKKAGEKAEEPVEQRIQRYSDSIRAFPRHPMYYYKRAKAYAAVGEYAKALKDLENADRLADSAGLDAAIKQEIMTLKKIIRPSGR